MSSITTRLSVDEKGMPNIVVELIRNVVAMALFIAGTAKVVSFGPIVEFGNILSADATAGLFFIGAIEIGMASWLFSRWQARARNVSTLLFFVGTLLYSTTRWFGGEQSCPCLGSVELPLVYSMIFSAFAVLSMAALVLKPRHEESEANGSGRAWGYLLAIQLGAGLMLAATISWAASSDVLPEWFETGLSVTHQSPVWQIDFAKNSEIEIEVLFRNHSRLDSRAINGCVERSCFAQCISNDLPMVLQPGEERTVTLKIFRDVGGVFSKESWQLFVEQVNNNQLPVDIAGQFPFQLEFVTDDANASVPLVVACEAGKGFLDGLRTRGGQFAAWTN